MFLPNSHILSIFHFISSTSYVRSTVHAHGKQSLPCVFNLPESSRYVSEFMQHRDSICPQVNVLLTPSMTDEEIS